MIQPGAAAQASPAAAKDSSTSGASYSTTNNQEEGVDEPDTGKTNGKTIFTISGDNLLAIAVDQNPKNRVQAFHDSDFAEVLGRAEFAFVLHPS